MSTEYRGIPGNVSTPFNLAILVSTSATPIDIITTTDHGLATGDRVMIIGHETNVAANGTHAIVVTGLNGFRLVGAVGVATGGVTGHVYPLGFAGGAALPDDGDNATAAAINTPNESNLDRAAYLVERVGAYRLAQIETVFTYAAAPNSAFASGSTDSAAWRINAAITSAFAGGNDEADIQPNDLLEAEFDGTIEVSGSATQVGLRLMYEIKDYGVAFAGTPLVGIGASSKLFYSHEGAIPQPVHLRGLVAPAAARGQKVKMHIQDYGVGGVQTYSLIGDACLTFRVWRPQ